jgi:beta-mannosidase
LVKDRTKSLPEDHLWGPRDYYKADFYKQSKAHFLSETGYHGCPDIESIKKFITPDKVWHYRDNDQWKLHSTDRFGYWDRVMLMEKQVRQLFGEIPEDPDTYATASQISQAEADKYFIERIRVGRPHKSGIIWWNLLDGWPQMSDAVVDYYFVKKLAYRYIKNSQAPFTVAADEMQNWGLPIYLCNDTRDIKRGHLRIWDADTEEILFERDFEAGANRSTPITKLPLFYSEKRLLIFDWTLDDGEVGRNHYLTGFPPFSLEKYLSWIEKGIL